MKTDDLSTISTYAGLRAVRKALAEEITACEKGFSARLRVFSFAKGFSFLLPAIRKLRNKISGTPFAKS